MFEIRINIPDKFQAGLDVVYTGHNKDGMSLYRIKDPKLNHIEIWHKRSESWTKLCQAIFNAIVDDEIKEGET